MTDLVAHFLIFSIVGVGALLAPLILGALLRPRQHTPEKDAVYECGEPTIGTSYIQFDLRFYTVALLFIIFDVEVGFFFPWATVYAEAALNLAWTGLADVLVFFAVLLVGFAYVWKRGDLDWVRAVTSSLRTARPPASLKSSAPQESPAALSV